MRKGRHQIHTTTMAASKLTHELYSLFDAEKYDQCKALLPPIQIELIKNNLFVPLAANTATADSVEDLKISQRILEIGALSSLLSHDYANFENFFAQLRPFYASSALHPKQEVNTDTTKNISLYLLYLLSQGWTLKFHVELELLYNLDRYDIDQDKYLQFPIAVERHLMEGNYIKIWKLLKLENDVPSREYTHFVDILTHALRQEISNLIEKTYDTIPVSNCKNMLYFPQEMSDSQFELVVRDEFGVDWKFQSGVITIDRERQDQHDKPAASIVNNVLNYADQIESIV